MSGFREYMSANVFKFTIGVFTCTSLGILAFLIGTTLGQGWPKLNLEFIGSAMRGSGLEGGIRYQIIGTSILILGAGFIVTPFAAAFALLQTVFLRSRTLKTWLLSFLHVLNATPSILFGILGFMFFVRGLRWEKSWLSGSIILATMILPTVTVSLIERIRTVPCQYIEAARGFGFNDDKIACAILLPYAWGGLLTGLVLGLARAAGETAPIMFTAAVFSGATLPQGIKDNPVLALPYHIFNLIQDSYSKESVDRAWATACVLILMVVSVSALAIPFRAKSHEEAKK